MIALKVPFAINSGAIATTPSYSQIVKGQVIDAVTTNQGERLMNPTYGCNILANLFDPGDTLVQSDVAGQIAAKLPNFVPRALVSDVALAPQPGADGTIIVNIRYAESQFSPAADVAIVVNTGDSNTDAATGSTQ